MRISTNAASNRSFVSRENAYNAVEGRHITMTYGDYFFIEAINKLRGEKMLFWNP